MRLKLRLKKYVRMPSEFVGLAPLIAPAMAVVLTVACATQVFAFLDEGSPDKSTSESRFDDYPDELITEEEPVKQIPIMPVAGPKSLKEWDQAKRIEMAVKQPPTPTVLEGPQIIPPKEIKMDKAKKILERTQELFFEKLEAKTGWGKNEIKDMYRDCMMQAMMENME